MENPIRKFFVDEKSDNNAEQNDSEKIRKNTLTTEIIKVDLRDYGFKKAGATCGNPETLRNSLQDIHNGYMIDVNEDEETQRKAQEKIKQEIESLELGKHTQEAELRKINESEIPLIKGQINQLKEETVNLDIENEKSKSSTFRNNFNLNLYWPVFIAATIFLYGFYLSAFHSAFFKDINKLASEANSDNISELLNTVFNIEAFKTFNLHWFAPIIFFVFSIGLHIILDADKKYRAFLFAGALIFILIADCLIAYFIEYNGHVIQLLNGMTDGEWLFYKSPRFYLVLFLGFFTCLGWSLILHAIKGEYEKQDKDGILKKEKQKLISKENNLNEKIQVQTKKAIEIEAAINKLKLQVEAKAAQLENLFYNTSSLNKRITAFYDGWLAFVTGLKGNENLIVECEKIKSESLVKN